MFVISIPRFVGYFHKPRPVLYQRAGLTISPDTLDESLMKSYTMIETQDQVVRILFVYHKSWHPNLSVVIWQERLLSC